MLNVALFWSYRPIEELAATFVGSVSCPRALRRGSQKGRRSRRSRRRETSDRPVLCDRLQVDTIVGAVYFVAVHQELRFFG